MQSQDDKTAGNLSPAGRVTDRPELIAYSLNDAPDVPLVTAPIERAWMEASADRFANRCLPLRIANQGGWLLLNPATVYLTWDGSGALGGVQIEYDGEPPATRALSHFGAGIVTFSLPYLFRTSPGWNLLARGPSNCPIDGLSPLEGVVETDWTSATFTMNWQLTRPGLRAVFPAGEPLCMVVPQRRGDIEAVRPISRPVSDDPQAAGELGAWAQSRTEFLRDLPMPGTAAARRKWEKDYYQGRLGGDVETPTAPSVEVRREVHQTRLRPADFASK
jgi:hypothetical protein